MGYDIVWFACQLASCNPATVVDAIIFEQQKAVAELLEQSGMTMQETRSSSGVRIQTLVPKSGKNSEVDGKQADKVPPPKPGRQGLAELLKPTDRKTLQEKIAAAMPGDWKLLDDSERETTWQSGKGAVQIGWHGAYVIGTGYGNFEDGLDAASRALTSAGLTAFDPQSGTTLP
ncbi:MAG: hypothetical protein R3D51_17710 [Hyphomicrobiaceae bacterium]